MISLNDMRPYPCPACGEEVWLSETDRSVYRPHCDVALHIIRDADFEDGMWGDLTKLIAKPKSQ